MVDFRISTLQLLTYGALRPSAAGLLLSVLRT